MHSISDDKNTPQCDHFFEGTEKNLKLIFTPGKNEKRNLYDVPKKDYSTLLNKINCSILGTKKNQHFTAYLLSESSLFVFKRKMILKTCGNILLLDFIQMFLDYLKNQGYDFNLEAVVYTRKKFLKPKLQAKVYQNFTDEVNLMDSILKKIDKNVTITSKNFGCFHVFFARFTKTNDRKKFYHFEILMNKLDLEKMKVFYSKNNTPKEATKKSGIANFIPEAVIDDYLFDPCGYSNNALIDDAYFTIHITPEKGFSYASFETNVELTNKQYSKLLKKVLDAFGPESFIVNSIHHRDLCDQPVKDFAKDSHDCLEVDDFKVTVRKFDKDS